MATKRMIALAIVDTDTFLDMPPSTQNLYFHLNVRADDDGFVGSPKRIARLVGSKDDDMRLLITKGFLIPFDSGVVVITHFNIHNTLKKDRYHPTIYTVECAKLKQSENKAYYVADGECSLDTNSFHNGSKGVPETTVVEDNLIQSGGGRDQATDYTKIWDEITSEDFDEIAAVYEDPERLVSYVDEYVRLHHIKVKGSARNYILGTAENKGWPRKPSLDPLLE